MDIALLEKLTREQFARFDAKDFAGCLSMMSSGCQVVDEVSGHWLRGTAEIGRYFDQVGQDFTDMESTLDDVVAADLDGTGLVTGMVHQTYRHGGATMTNTAPLTVVFVREQGHWNIGLVHAVALPLADTHSAI